MNEVRDIDKQIKSNRIVSCYIKGKINKQTMIDLLNDLDIIVCFAPKEKILLMEE